MQTFLQALLLAGQAIAGSVSPQCKCIYGQPCWPSANQFTALQSQLTQPLIYPKPPESACYPASRPQGNCSDVIAHNDDGRWRSDQPGSMQIPNFDAFIFPNGTISACYLDPSLGFPCEQGRVSPIGVDVRTVRDVQSAVKFAVKHNLKLVVKNTGHDYLGRSAARGSFLVWTHHLKNITYNPSFVPRDAPSSETYDAITLGAGVQWYEAYAAAHARNRLLVGGLSAGGSVGSAGGWLAGGGHSALSPTRGLGVDNVVEFEVVTSNGDFLTVNSHRHSDLFWALRGGGGGTYAIVISATYRTWPDTPLIGVFFEANFSRAVAKDLVSEFARTSVPWSDKKWGGYAFVGPEALSAFFVAPNITQGEANATLAPLSAYARNLTDQVVGVTVPFDSFYSWFTSIFPVTGQVGGNVELVSRLFSRTLLEHSSDKVAETLISFNTTVLWHSIAGGVVSDVEPDSVGLNPAWRKAIAHLVGGDGWADGSSAIEINKARDRLKASLKVLENLTGPDAGAYFNEASLYERDFQTTFFGSHYKKLSTIKEKYDSSHLFVVAEGVGSERWDKDLLCRR